jgi:hypothetical protein
VNNRQGATLEKQLMHFYRELRPCTQLPAGISTLYPQQKPGVINVVEQFLHKYYNDTNARRLILGINPGRFGAGITGVNFTGPRQLSAHCGIEHAFGNSSELSAEFMYEMIEQYGGASSFYGNWFIGAVCPLGFVKNGKNINYYDDKNLAIAVKPFIIDSIQQQTSFNIKRDYCICIGEDKNYKFLSSLNEQFNWFDKIIALPHPRFILQYRRKKKQEYIDQYLKGLKAFS